MSEKLYKNAPLKMRRAIKKSEIVEDFLPDPAKLTENLEKQKITINLSKNSVEKFKKYAKKNGVKYQTLISSVIDAYSAKI